jgi:hypothetical protein
MRIPKKPRSKEVEKMKLGDRVVSKVNINSFQMFCEKHEIPNESFTKSGSTGTIEEMFDSGWGIVKFENGTRVLMSNIKEKFSKVENGYSFK